MGPLTSPKLANLSGDSELWLQYGSEIPDGESATVRVHDFSATHYTAGNSYKSSGYVQHKGDKFWIYLDPESTQLALTRQSGTGTAVFRYKPVWF